MKRPHFYNFILNRKAGFTFIELMVVSSIFAVIAVAVYSTFGIGIFAWKKSQNTQNLLQDIRLSLDKMAQDLENAVLYSKEAGFSNFTGEKNKISFYSLVEVFSSLPPHSELRKITYSLNGNVLQRLEQTYPEYLREEEQRLPEEIANQISNLNFSYCYSDEEAQPPYKWKDTWDSLQVIPQAVKIELELGIEKAVTFTKYVFIPTGEKGKENEEK